MPGSRQPEHPSRHCRPPRQAARKMQLPLVNSAAPAGALGRPRQLATRLRRRPINPRPRWPTHGWKSVGSGLGARPRCPAVPRTVCAAAGSNEADVLLVNGGVHDLPSTAGMRRVRRCARAPHRRSTWCTWRLSAGSLGHVTDGQATSSLPGPARSGANGLGAVRLRDLPAPRRAPTCRRTMLTADAERRGGGSVRPDPGHGIEDETAMSESLGSPGDSRRTGLLRRAAGCASARSRASPSSARHSASRWRRRRQRNRRGPRAVLHRHGARDRGRSGGSVSRERIRAELRDFFALTKLTPPVRSAGDGNRSSSAVRMTDLRAWRSVRRMALAIGPRTGSGHQLRSAERAADRHRRTSSTAGAAPGRRGAAPRRAGPPRRPPPGGP